MTLKENTATSPEVSPRVALTRLVQGYRVSEAIFAALKLGIPDLIAGGQRDYQELARTSGAHAPSLYRLLRYLSTLGVLEEGKTGNFALTPIGEPLRSGIPGSVSRIVRMFSEPYHQQPWNNLLYSVKTGETAFHRVHGMDLFPYLAQHPENASVFNNAMTEGSTQSSTAIARAYDFSTFGTIMDVGGGHGRLLIEVLKANPNVQGVLFERPDVAEGARKEIEASGLKDRCRIVAGNFFEEVPLGCDGYILRRVIHDWDDETCIKILKNIRRAIPSKGKLLIHEAVLPEHMEESPLDQVTASMDINMLVITGGRERTANEFRSILEASGFELTQIVATEVGDCVLEATPV